ncbi:ribonuclease H-like domain-containing protein [Tanacetum coccineum]|uniref:Ribonuclease H-like domain-containing protein n=1 Tax=Tanacetum coccineum TaxID=301880 RepID=A0ABQ4Y2U6_9ASTR
MTHPDPRWNMDTGASSHLVDNTVTKDNDVFVEFDAFGFSVKDYRTSQLLLRCDSNGDLYPVTHQPSSTPFALLSFSHSTWHIRLGHPGDVVLRNLVSRHFINCNGSKVSNLCHAYQLGKHVKLPFYSSESRVESVFDIIHSDLWTSLILSVSGIKYYAIFLDHFSHYLWVYPLHHKSDLFSKFVEFCAFVNKQFNVDIKSCDHGASSSAFVQRVITSLHSEFAMTDLGSLNYFLAISAQRSSTGLFFLSQSTYAEEILERAHMQKYNPCRTPVDTKSKLGADGDPVCLCMHDPGEPHLAALKRILRYVRGTIDHGLQLHVSSTSQLTAYIDADWAGCPATRRSTSGYCVFLSDNLLSWFAKWQVTLSHSSAEAEYRGVANVAAETVWARNLLHELHAPLFTATLVFVTTPRTYKDLSDTEKKRYDADVRATNIVLQGLPKDIYKLINHNIEAKAIWDNVKMLLAGSELTKEDRESQLYDEFERFKMLPGENINEYYVRFHKLVNDMRNIIMTMPNIQLNSKFVNNMSPEWDRFVTAVKLNKGLKETNHEQLYAYLKQHEKHAAQDRLIIERITPATNDQLAFVSTVQPHAQSSHVQSHQYPSSSTNPQSLQYP